MSDREFILQSTSKAIADSKEALHLLEQKQRVENSVLRNDPALTLDTSKALLETTYKTILKDIVENPDLSKTMIPLYEDVKANLLFNRDDKARNILENIIGEIAKGVPQLRNKFGASSHGKDGHYISPIEMPEAEMVAYLVDGVSGFLLRKSRLLANPEYSQRIYYEDYEEFNDYLDTSYDSVDLKINNSTPIPHSKALFVLDRDGYTEYLIQFNNQKEEEELTFEISTNSELTEIVPVAENQQDQAELFPNKQEITDE
jgi:hypothetical protein